MGSRRKRRKLATVHMDQLNFKGVSGLTIDEGKPEQRWMAKGACIGDIVSVQTSRKGKASLIEVLEPSPNRIEPECPHFLTCGGCQLQHTPLALQREHKEKMIRRLFADFKGTVHPIVGAEGYHYRNKMELSFGTRRFYTDPQEASSATDGSYLGLHPWKWYSKIVPLSECSLAHPSIDRAIRLLGTLDLFPAWNTYDHTGVWRHIVLRHGGGLLINLVTSSEATQAQVQSVCDQLLTLSDIRGILWTINDGVAEVATGELKSILYGVDTLEMTLCGKTLEIPYDGFAQVNDEGAELLMQCIAEATESSTTLFDLYCGSGAIGIALSDNFESVTGIEIQPEAIERAKKNAKQNNVSGTWIGGKVEDCLPKAIGHENSTILLDPPREGLHPKAATFFAEQKAQSLVYVACNSKSLARDRAILEAGCWKMTDLWMVDMFPQTPHVECVGKFICVPTDQPSQVAE